jgi:hypothetical protein
MQCLTLYCHKILTRTFYNKSNYKSGEIRGEEITTDLKGNSSAYPQL